MSTTTTVLISGNTFPVKDQLKALGGKWDAEAKGWRVPAAVAEQAQALVAGAPASKKSSTKSTRRTTCVSCGERVRYDSRGYPSIRIYRSGECQDCYEERKMGY